MTGMSSDTDDSADEISGAPRVAVLVRRRSVDAPDDGFELQPAPLSAQERNALKQAAEASRSKLLPPPPSDWQWDVKVLQADGASAQDIALSRIRSGALTGAASSASAGGPASTADSGWLWGVASRKVSYWSGSNIDGLCNHLANADVLAVDAEWLVQASAARPRPGALSALPTLSAPARRTPCASCPALEP